MIFVQICAQEVLDSDLCHANRKFIIRIYSITIYLALVRQAYPCLLYV